MMGGSYQSVSMAYGLRQLIEESIEPDSWYDLSETGEGTITIFPQETPKKLAIYQTPEAHQRIEILLDQLRKALGHQVSIEARFLAVTENFLEDIGLDVDFSYNFGGKWGVGTFNQGSSVMTSPTIGTGVAGNLGNLATQNPGASVTGGYGSVLDDLQVAFLLRATQARTDSKSLAAPKLTVLSGESASFSLMDTVSYALPPTETQGVFQDSTSGTTGQSGSYQNVSFIMVGSQLSITPTISKDKKYVLLNIQTIQTDLLGFARHAVEVQNARPGHGGDTYGQRGLQRRRGDARERPRNRTGHRPDARERAGPRHPVAGRPQAGVGSREGSRGPDSEQDPDSRTSVLQSQQCSGPEDPADPGQADHHPAGRDRAGGDRGDGGADHQLSTIAVQ